MLILWATTNSIWWMESREDKLKFHNIKFIILQVLLDPIYQGLEQLCSEMDLREDRWEWIQGIWVKRFLNMIKQAWQHQEVVKEDVLLFHTKIKDTILHKTWLLNHFYQSNKTNRICTESHHFQLNQTFQSKINTT